MSTCPQQQHALLSDSHRYYLQLVNFPEREHSEPPVPSIIGSRTHCTVIHAQGGRDCARKGDSVPLHRGGCDELLIGDCPKRSGTRTRRNTDCAPAMIDRRAYRTSTPCRIYRVVRRTQTAPESIVFATKKKNISILSWRYDCTVFVYTPPEIAET